MSLDRRTLVTATTALATSILIPSRRTQAAEAGIRPDRILMGQAAPLEGPAAALGLGMRDGITAAFAEVNRNGGVHGRRLELLSRDDGYEPNRSIEVTRKLLEEDRVFALLGPVGTPTSQAAQPIAAAAGAPFIGPFTGAEFLRDPRLGNVVNLRASYFRETETMVERLTRDLGASKIAIFYQDDAFGRAGLAGVRHALERRSMSLAAEGTYERNTVAVRSAVLAIQRGRPDAVIMIGAPKPCAEFIKVARQVRLAATFINISFVGSEPLAQELGANGAGVVVTQVVPFPHDTSMPFVRRYQQALRGARPDAAPGFVSIEGYMVGRLTAAALERIPGEPTRRNFLDAVMRGGPFDLDGVRLAFGENDNQGSDEVHLTVIQPDGSFRPVPRLAAPQG